MDLALTTSESIAPVVAGSGAGNLTYVVALGNDGSSQATGLILSEALTLPAGVTAVSITPSDAPSQGTPASPWPVEHRAMCGDEPSRVQPNRTSTTSRAPRREMR